MINKVNGNGVTRAVFECIKENNGYPFNWIVNNLTDCGYKKTSVSSLISQMVAQGMVAKTHDGGLWVQVDEYSPLKSPRKKKKYQRKPVVKALEIVAKQQPSAPLIRMTSAKVLESMSVKEAHALYLELLSMFGESK